MTLVDHPCESKEVELGDCLERPHEYGCEMSEEWRLRDRGSKCYG